MELTLVRGAFLVAALALLAAACALGPRIRVWYVRRRERESKEKLLDQLWQQHENLQMHVDWARSRGEHTTGRQLMVQLRSLGEDIRQVQTELAAAELGIAPEISLLSQKHFKEAGHAAEAAPNSETAENATLLRRAR